MGTADRLRTDDVAGGGTPAPLLAGKSVLAPKDVSGNQGASDVRGTGTKLTQTITLNSFGGTDSFKVRVYSKRVNGDITTTDTAAFVRGTNAAASDLQTALRTATGDTALTVSGTTDAGPYTVTFVNKSKHRQHLLALVTLSGCSGNVTRPALAYDDADVHTSSLPNGIAFDQETSRGAFQNVPLGTSIVSDGTGQTRGTTLQPPTMVSAVGGSGQVVVDTTEVSSGGTSAEVLFCIVNTSTGAVVLEDSQDSDGDATLASLSAGDYYLLYHTVTANGQVSRSGAPEFFTVT